MEAVAKLNNVPTSPRKMRLVADLIRGKKVDLALNTLKFDSKVGSKRLEKLLLSAISNWQEKNKDDIFIWDTQNMDTYESMLGEYLENNSWQVRYVNCDRCCGAGS